MPAYQDYRRWALESAALDLALRQAGEPLHAVLGREPQPLRFGVSLRLGEPPSASPVLRRRELYGDVRYKLDYAPEWDAELIGALAGTGAVDVVDFKGAYKGTIVDVDTDARSTAPARRRLPTRGSRTPTSPTRTPPQRSSPTAPASPGMRRSTRSPTSTASASSPRAPTASRRGSGRLQRLFDFYDHCAAEGIALYGGGQSELGVGRGQIQLLAGIFHPDGPNDVAPAGWDHDDFPETGLPVSPLDPAPDAIGFRRLT